MTNATAPAISRKPSSIRLTGRSVSPAGFSAPARRATRTPINATTGQPSPINSRFDPVMLAEAYWVHSEWWPDMYA